MNDGSSKPDFHPNRSQSPSRSHDQAGAPEQNDSFFRDLTARAQIGAVHLDREGRITYLNPFARHLLSNSDRDLIGTRFTTFLTPLSKPPFRRHFGLHLDGEHGQYELILLNDRGQEIEVLVWATPDLLLRATSSGVFLNFVDISVSKAHTRSLLLERDLNQKLAAATDLKAALDIVIEAAMIAFPVDSVGIYLVADEGDLNLAAHRGFGQSFVQSVSHFAGDSSEADLVRRGEAIYAACPHLPVPHSPACPDEGLQSMGMVPVFSGDQVVAAIGVASHQADLFPEASRRILETIAGQLSLSIHRLRMENQLRNLEDQYRLIVEHAQEAIFVVQECRFQFINAMFEKITGFCRDDLLQLVLDDLVLPEDRPLKQAFSDAFLDDSRKHDSVRFRIMPRRGAPIWCEIKPTTILWNGKPAVLAFMTDISQRMRVEEELRVQKAYLEELFEGAPEAIVLLDNGDRVLKMNREFSRLFGYSTDEVIGHRINDLIVPKHLRAEGLAATQHVADGRTIHLETVRQHKNGKRIDVSILGKPILLGRDQLAVYGIYRDITDLKAAEAERQKLEEQVRRTQKLESLGVLAGGIAHDFNNLLVGILGNANTGMRALPKDSPLRQHLSDIEAAALRAAELTNQMLAYSGKGHFVVRPVDLSKLILDMSDFLKATVSKKTQLDLDVTPDLPPVEADHDQLRQVVMSLVANASEAIGGAEGRIRISTGVMHCDREFFRETYLAPDLPEGAYAFLEVADSGCGMDERTKKAVFDPFFTTKFTGRGLGLAAVLGIVRGHHGAIEISSTEGEGSVFRILLPRADLSHPASELPVSQPDPVKSSGRAILFVDDEDIVRDTALRMLETLEYTVLLACDGREALEIYRHKAAEIDLIILDMKMPHMDGDEAFRRIRELNPEAKIILSSGYSEQVVKQQFTQDTPSGFIQKPYRLADIEAKIRSVLG